jgi:hypothetical protein
MIMSQEHIKIAISRTSSSYGRISYRQSRALKLFVVRLMVSLFGLSPAAFTATAINNELSVLDERRRTTSTQCYSDGTVKNAQKVSMLYGNLNAFYTLNGGFGIGLGAPGDIDGDGAVDLVVGTPYDDDGGSNAGAVYVLFLETDGSVKKAQKLSNLYGNIGSFYVLYASDMFGHSVAGLGDSDGDGVADLVVGALFDDDGGSNAGAVYVLYLQTDGSVKNAQKLSQLYGNFNAFYTLDVGDDFGSGVSALGDFDGDSVGDLAVGAYHDGDGGTSTGAVYILFLATDGNVKNAQKVSNWYGNFGAFYTLVGSGNFGVSVAVLGDIDGDSLLDLAVGNQGDGDGGTNAGAFFVLFLDTNGSVNGAQKVSMLFGSFSTYYTLDASDNFGCSLAALGDIDGNGVVDLAVGSLTDDDGGSNTGAVYVLYLKTDGDVSSAQKLSNFYGNANGFYTFEASDYFGMSVAALGDVDGDGVTDLAVGAYADDDGSAGAGAVYVVNLQQSYCETVSPTLIPTAIPLPIPSAQPTLHPSLSPSLHPSTLPVPAPTASPTLIPTALPLPVPSAQPTLHPSLSPSLHPSTLPVPAPTASPNLIPTALPLPVPSAQPTLHPSLSPSLHPSTLPVPAQSTHPTLIPAVLPLPIPTESSPTEVDGSTSGTCYHYTSTVTRLAANGKSAAQVPMTELKEGDRILALDEHATPKFAKVEALPHAPSTEPFMHIVMTGKGKQGLKVTLHHTFDTCVGKHNPFMHAVESYGAAVVMAKDIKAGDCLHTADGKRSVRSAALAVVQEGDVTYSIKLADRSSTVAIGGVFTHAMGHLRNKHRTPSIPEEQEKKIKKLNTKTHL